MCLLSSNVPCYSKQSLFHFHRCSYVHNTPDFERSMIFWQGPRPSRPALVIVPSSIDYRQCASGDIRGKRDTGQSSRTWSESDGLLQNVDTSPGPTTRVRVLVGFLPEVLAAATIETRGVADRMLEYYMQS